MNLSAEFTHSYPSNSSRVMRESESPFSIGDCIAVRSIMNYTVEALPIFQLYHMFRQLYVDRVQMGLSGSIEWTAGRMIRLVVQVLQTSRDTLTRLKYPVFPPLLLGDAFLDFL